MPSTLNCATTWCRSAYICLVDSSINDAFRILAGSFCSLKQSFYHYSIACIKSAEIPRKRACLIIQLRLARRISYPNSHFHSKLMTKTAEKLLENKS